MIAIRHNRFEFRFVNIVAVIAQSLPVRTIPELHHIATVRDDVIDEGCKSRATLS